MKQLSETVLFFGSGPVAAKSLELLLPSFNVEAVITKPRAEHHRGSVPVLELAEQQNIQTFTVTNKKTLDDLVRSHTFTSRLAVLIDFGIIVSQEVIDNFQLGIVNSHFSLLPEWRGADPITFSILSGQPRTGVSLMLLTAGMDEGPLLAQADYNLDSQETTPSLTDALIELSNACLTTVIPGYTRGEVIAQPQLAATIAETKSPTYSRKLTKADGQLNLHKPAAQLEREIRGYIEWPKSHTKLAGVDVIVTASHVATGADDDAALQLECKDSTLTIDRLKPAGKKEMSAAEFIRGYGTRL